MSSTQILRLDEYRERRDLRLRLARSLHGADPGRAGLVEHLARLASLVGADRVATLWVDEYGQGLVHPHVVLDLLSDRPRRVFSLESLRRAWDQGVPGMLQAHGLEGPRVGDVSAWTLAVALGSDGTRSWFVVADSVTPRSPLSAEVRDHVMFLAGECAGVVLHRDLDAASSRRAEGTGQGSPRFAGWSILQDLEGRQPDERESRRIAKRFVVARLPRLLADDDLAISSDRMRQQAERAREEVMAKGGEDDLGAEVRCWGAVLDAFQEGDLIALAQAMVALGEDVENQNHLNGAAEIYQTAYEIFAATGQNRAAVGAARFSGRALRRLARWDEAEQWYGVAREVAETLSMHDQVALALSGWASALQDRGSLPAARAVLDEALPFAQESRDRFVLGYVFHGLLALEHIQGNLSEALAWGWQAVTAYDHGPDRVRGLASLAGALIDAHELDAAEDGWDCVLHLADDDYYRLYATDALGHIAALRGNGAVFAHWAARADAMDWEAGPSAAKAEILLYRGLSYRTLGDTALARGFLERALAFAEENGFTRILFAAETALRDLGKREKSADCSRRTFAQQELRTGLRDMRAELAMAPSGGGPAF